MPHEVVISGISGRFPECSNLDELKSKLFAKETLLRHEPSPWSECPADRKSPTYSGKVPNWRTFDDSFFGMPPKLAHNIDPYKGIMLERTFEAIIDSGNNPFDLRGHHIGVVTGNSLSEAEVTRFAEGAFLEGNGMIGHAKTMQSNRVSYFFNFTGPSFNCDTSGSSAVSAMEMARIMVADGAVEAAVVGSINLVNFNSINTEYEHLNYFSPSGQCFPFDEKAEGLVRSEGAVVFFLQRAQDAKRSYGTILKSSVRYLGDRLCGFVAMDSTYNKFLRHCYNGEEFTLDEVCYVEANSCAHKDIDALELNAIANTFQRTKENPLLIGSVAGNIGFGDTVAGFFSIAKTIVALESNVIPPTLNYTSPNPRVPALLNGILKPVTEPTMLSGDTVAVTNINIFGSVDHVVLRRHQKTKKTLPVGALPEDGLHRLVTFQARHEQGASQTMKQISSMPVDTDFVSLVNDVFKTSIPAYIWRGYTLLPLDKPSLQNIANVEVMKKPLWYVFSGMGSQYIGMGQDLLQFPVFSAAIAKCDRALRPKGIDIKEIITTTNPAVFDTILNCFVGIAAIQIGLVDILMSVGVSPDGMIGHSVGELGCAYADECFTAEETILAAYARGKASLEATVIKGMMAAIGIGYNKLKDRLPESIDIACHNSADSCTISGPTDDVTKYVEELQSQGVFARTVSAGGLPYHSRYIKAVAPRLLQYLKETITTPKARSSKWISSSVPKSEWETNEAKLCSAEYHTNNLLSPVLFEEACVHVPENAVLLEIAPRGLLQAILKKSMKGERLNLSMTDRNAHSNVINVLNTLGRLYINGVDINVNNLYPTVEYPVARNTPSLANLITWNHEEAAYEEFTRRITWMLSKGSKATHMDIHPEAPEYKEWKNFSINGQTHVPLSCLLMYPWQMIFATKHLDSLLHPVTFENVMIKTHLPVQKEGSSIVVTFAEMSSNFEISIMNENETYDNFLVGSLWDSDAIDFTLPSTQDARSDLEDLNKGDVYTIFKRFDYELSSDCQIIERILLGEKECFATLVWTGELKWFVDALFHTVMIFYTDKEQRLMLPACWTKMQINVPLLISLEKGSQVQVHYDMRCNRLLSDSVELLGLVLSPYTDSPPPNLSWNELKLQPYMDTTLTEKNFWSISFQLAAETSFMSWCNVVVPVQVLVVKDENHDNAQFISKIKETQLAVLNYIELRVTEMDFDSAKKALGSMKPQCLIVAGEFNTISQLALDEGMNHNIYFLACVNPNNGLKPGKSMRPVLSYVGEEYSLFLLKKETQPNKFKTVEAKSNEWLAELRKWSNKDTTNSIVVLYAHHLTPNEVLPVLAREPFANRVRTVFVEDKEAPNFSLNSSLYSSQLCLGLPVNILSGRVWNSRRAFDLDLKQYTIKLDSFLNSKQSDETSISFIGLNTKFISDPDSSSNSVTNTEVELVDYSGWAEGQKMMGMAQYDTKSNKVTTDSVLRWKIPDFWTMEGAVTVPVTYSLAFYCIFLQGKLNTGESVLVHTKMCLLRQAVTNVALHLGAQVFVSVKDDEEAITLQKQFPSLNFDHVVVLHRQNLRDRVKRLTHGNGVDLIINGHGGKLLQDAVSLSADFGRFLHLSCTKIGSGEFIGLSTFFKNNFVKAVNLNSIINCDEECKEKLREAIKAGIEHGIIHPFQRSVFTPSQQTEALCYLQLDPSRKTIVSTNELQLRKEITAIQDCIKVIVSENHTEFLLDLADWLVEQGCRKLIVVTGEDQLNDSHLRRFSRLVDSKQVFVAFASTNRLDTHHNAVSFFKELLHVATITSIFCIGVDENGPVMKSLDSASRGLLPQLKDFVSLLGKGSVVSDSRASSNLPVISVQSQTPLLSPEHILPYLANILKDTENSQARFFLVENKLSTTVKLDIVDYSSFLPNNLDDLIKIGAEICDFQTFSIVPTLSPGYQHVCRTLLPVFVVPGLSSHHLTPLIQKLIHPAFSCSLPESFSSVQQLAECLLKEVEKVQSQGPYNIIGESWSGAVALTLSCMLEARGHKVELFLIEGVPSTSQDRIKTLCNDYDKNLETSLISALFNIPKVSTGLMEVDNIDEVLLSSVSETTPESKLTLIRATRAMKNLLENISRYQPTNYVFKGNLTVISHRPLSLTDTSLLSQISAKAPKVMISNDDTYEKMISSSSTAAIINENIIFTWNNREVSQADLNRTDEYLQDDHCKTVTIGNS